MQRTGLGETKQHRLGKGVKKGRREGEEGKRRKNVVAFSRPLFHDRLKIAIFLLLTSLTASVVTTQLTT